MQIPSELNTLLGRDPMLHGAVESTLAEFEQWLNVSHPPFFPDFTDHGLTHLNEVLHTAWSIARPEARDLLTPEDAAVLTLAVLLHDLAMHLGPDGFWPLVQGNTAHEPLLEFDDPHWPAAWGHFLWEARRFSGRENELIFGGPEPVPPPTPGSTNFTDSQRRLMGEFVRRHHHRLAHQIALQGFPGPDDQRSLALAPKLDRLANLAGLVGRSHGMPLRPCLDYLNRKYQNKVHPRSVHAPFLMVLLRIADYLQIQPSRAPLPRLRVQSLRSPIAAREWKKHAALIDLSPAPDDPEAVQVHFEPPDVATFLGVRDLLAGLQAELDASWAALGEVYGLHERDGLNRLGITIRRVRSNLDDPVFRSSLRYVPERLSFQTAGPEVLNLLVGPLYSQQPEIGIRELLQNAVDAVRELDAYCAHHGVDKQRLDLPSQEAEVLISIDEEPDGGAWATVSDRGIGMTSETVRNYFLRAGASFRNSEAWQKEFLDSEDRSTVLRSGRFGVGALAAFLLGPEIEVTTRHVSQPEGIRFIARIHTDPIEIRRHHRPIGTTVRIRLTPEAAKRLLDPSVLESGAEGWDWYRLDEPSVARFAKGRKLPQQPSFPALGSKPSAEWHRLDSSDGQIVYWSPISADERRIACNGIVISGGHSMTYGGHIAIRTPALCIFDPDGRTPLNLMRDRLLFKRWSLMDQLVEEIVKSTLAFFLVKMFKASGAHRHGAPLANLLWQAFGGDWILLTRDGISLAEAALLSEFRITALSSLPEELVTKGMLTPFPHVPLVDAEPLRVFGPFGHHPVPLQAFGCQVAALRFLAHAAHWQQSWGERESLKASVTEEQRLDPWILLRYGNCGPSQLNWPDLVRCASGTIYETREVLAFELYLGGPAPDYTPSTLAEAWRKYLRSPVIPYNPEVRRRKLAHAYKELKPYIESWEALSGKS